METTKDAPPERPRERRASRPPPKVPFWSHWSIFAMFLFVIWPTMLGVGLILLGMSPPWASPPQGAYYQGGPEPPSGATSPPRSLAGSGGCPPGGQPCVTDISEDCPPGPTCPGPRAR